MNYKNITYTIKPSACNIILCYTTQDRLEYEIEKKLTDMSEYKDAKLVLSKFTQHGQN